MTAQPTTFVGIDWATEEHVVNVLDVNGELVEELTVEHSGKAIHRLAERLADRADGIESRVCVAIEVPRGALVEMMIERGFRVFALNPKQLDRFRDRFFPSGAKDDSKDAFVLAHSLITDRGCFREVQLDDPLIVQIREYVRVHDDLRQERNRIASRLRDSLIRYFPAVLKIARDVDEPWILELLERAPTPDRAGRLKVGTIDKLLRKHRIRRITANEVATALRAEPLRLTPGSVEAASAHVALMIPRLRLVQQQSKIVRRRLDSLLESLAPAEREDPDEEPSEHRDAEIILSLPGAGTIVTATVLGEAAQAIRDRDYSALRAHAGVAPITKQTGKRKHGKAGSRRPTVIMRRGANGRLRNALYHWARVASMCDPASKRYYAAQRSRGHTHGRALRAVADRLLRIMFAMLDTGTLYDSSRFEAPPESVAA